MFPGVHDCEIVAYSVDGRTCELVLHAAPGTGSAEGAFDLVFHGVAAHSFPHPLLPAIVLSLAEVPLATLLARESARLSAGNAECGWPGPWFPPVERAVAHCVEHGLKAFELASSYGMSGWIIARGVECRDAHA